MFLLLHCYCYCHCYCIVIVIVHCTATVVVVVDGIAGAAWRVALGNAQLGGVHHVLGARGLLGAAGEPPGIPGESPGIIEIY